jgi:hypothetical protein
LALRRPPKCASWMSRRETNFGSLTGEGFEQDRGTHRTEAAFPE